MSVQHTKEKVKGSQSQSERKPEVNIQTDSKSRVDGQVLDTRFQTKYSIGVNAKKLEKELKKKISGEVRFDDGSRALYSTDASNYRQIPIGVVLPKTEEDVIHTINICRKYGAPILSRGGGTSLAGQCCNVAVMMDMSKYYNQVLHIDQEKKFSDCSTRNCSRRKCVTQQNAKAD